jgi:hypothetical protein
MGVRQKYKKKPTSFITAVQLDLDTEGFTYNKWGGKQVCKRDDWIVNNNGDTYTIAKESFAQTYEFVSHGVYFKSAPVWAEVAEKAGNIKTKEGETAYKAGDYLVYNNEDGTDGYAMSPANFKAMYKPADIEPKQSE